MAKSIRKRFSPEFKREAVRLLERGDKEISQLARELGVRRNQLYKWKAELENHGEAAFPGKGGRPKDQLSDETAALKSEVKKLDQRIKRLNRRLTQLTKKNKAA